ncbi:P-loop-containing nucleoside triphosphate hydrolase [Chloropicon primus]|uniref:P-loop-containing nucleoside triphosphate hydrolase n=1 Tax=Chloropicon primus TaxID=1764295 RepID=A0A5B8MR69_9CHLO|nr:P-loop-containing nucleoside triphosphate hydrolase [Chloropicon primus]|eukprot:QDZ22827.1 P-loop-containing nucleoside triphosphate hydrolase [Chloropicon primus]
MWTPTPSSSPTPTPTPTPTRTGAPSGGWTSSSRRGVEGRFTLALAFPSVGGRGNSGAASASASASASRGWRGVACSAVKEHQGSDWKAEEEGEGLELELELQGGRGRLTGRLQGLPQVAPHGEHLGSALRRVNRVTPPKTVKSKHKREISACAMKLDALTKELAVPLGKYVKGFPAVDRLHPFEAALLHLTVGADKYEALLSRVNGVRKKILDAGKANASRASKCKSPKEAGLVLEEGLGVLENIYKKEETTMDKLLYFAQQLRRLPFVDPKLETFVLAGAPNVGKSSLVVSLSSGQPEVCNYPFTTKTIKMGHFDVAGERYQVTDTPGLLSRSDEERNEMEGLTMAALEHLDNLVVLFVMDLTGECGTTVKDQLDIRREIMTRFPEMKAKWVDIFTKADMFSIKEDEGGAGSTEWGGEARVIEDRDSRDKYHVDHEFLDPDYNLALKQVPNALWISTMTGLNVDTLKKMMLQAILV